MIDLKAAGEPRLETERLFLHPHRLEDFADSAALWKDPVVTRYIGGKPSTDEECWARLLKATGHWALLGFGYFVVREKTTGRCVGEVGLANFHREITPPFGDAPEMGWVLAPSAHGKGYATEAVRAVIGFAEAKLHPERLVCMITPENTASIKVAERCGFREYAQTSYHGGNVVLFERPTAG